MVGEEVEALHPRSRRGGRGSPAGVQGDEAAEIGTGLGKDLLEDPAHGEDGGTRLDMTAGRIDAAHLAAGLSRPLDHGDVEAGMGEAQGGDQPRDPRSDDDHPASGHARSSSRRRVPRRSFRVRFTPACLGSVKLERHCGSADTP